MSSGQIDVGLVVDIVGSAPGQFCVVHLVDGRDVFMREMNLTEVLDDNNLDGMAPEAKPQILKTTPKTIYDRLNEDEA